MGLYRRQSLPLFLSSFGLFGVSVLYVALLASGWSAGGCIVFIEGGVLVLEAEFGFPFLGI